MAKRGREGAAKRARELARQEKQQAKREERLARSTEIPVEPDIDETALLEEFARLSERYEASLVSEADYTDERRRIFTELGIDDE